MKPIHLVCNAHLDFAWLWEWDEGIAEVLSTFRTAVSFCEEFDGFIFNHNEAILYKQVEEYDPGLFEQICGQAAKGNWHIMGGWYLQPDCNMPSGESLIRQILLGRNYFKEKFNAKPTTAINVDSFGHTRGLVQILKKSGYDSYLVCRPEGKHLPLPADDFIWIGYDGSEITVHRAEDSYNSKRGQARSKVVRWMETNREKKTGMVLWGIGNHGGGPSKVDLCNLKELMKSCTEHNITHSTPEAYFRDLKEEALQMPRFDQSLNPWAVGCYTSQIRIKQKHRLLENELFMTEKMASNACLQGNMDYPKENFHEVSCDLAMSEFHDILSGSSIQSVEENALRLLDHGLESLARIKIRSFFVLAGEQEKAQEGDIPIFIYNPHPFKISGIFECEFNLPDINHGKSFSNPHICKDGIRLLSQVEKEWSNLNIDWRKRIVFEAELEPSQISRFHCGIEILPEKPGKKIAAAEGSIVLKTEDLHIVINCRTGFIDKLESKGWDYLEENSFRPVVIKDDDDSWGTEVHSFPDVAGAFELMSGEEAAHFSGMEDNIADAVRIIEDGEVRTVVEALYSYEDSFICQTFMIPKHGTEIQVESRVFWNEKKKLLKLSVPTLFKNAGFIGQVAYGVEELPIDGTETVTQKWNSVCSGEGNRSVTCINDCVYGSSFSNGELQITLLRSPAYTSMDIKDGYQAKEDRFLPHMDQGERIFHFWLNVGNADERQDMIDREALVKNEKPYVLSFFPSGSGRCLLPLILLEDGTIQMTAFKKAEQSDDYIIRLFEPTGKDRTTNVIIPLFSISQTISMKKFEIKTLRLDIERKTLIETDLMEDTI